MITAILLMGQAWSPLPIETTGRPDYFERLNGASNRLEVLAG